MSAERPGASLLNRGISRRTLLRVGAAAGLAAPLAACGDGGPWHDMDVTGTSPSLEFTLQRAPGGATVTGADYLGHVTMLYFGYTFCPDVCPLTMQNAGTVFTRMGADAKPLRFLFVTVDPGRDTLPVLGQYVSLFGPQFVGLRGTPDELARLARRFRIAYSVDNAGAQEEVTHSSAVYVFDQTGAARLLVPSLANANPDIEGVSADLTRLVHERSGVKGWLERFV